MSDYAWADVTAGQVASVEAINGLGQQVETLAAAPTVTALTLQNGWVNYGGGFPTAQYERLPSGLIVTSGIVKGGTTTDGTNIASYGIRPRAGAKSWVARNSGSPGWCYLQLNADGTLQIRSPNAIDPGFIYLDCVIFRTAD